MATESKPTPKVIGQAAPPKAATPKEEKIYYIVNPAGTIHAVDYEHARWRMSSLGYRAATAAEVAEYQKRGGNQVHDKPIAPPWTPEPVELQEPEEPEA